ncbi:PrpF domain-containing protein [Actinoplanes sp. HUAS TT8]|uniref:PrpF domain-containing protein n=1 Tax=Actinoplanes sp. HUAS TT8 TaxID=3447453 RepID=UPI003F524AB2
MRAGAAKCAYFLAGDLPAEPAASAAVVDRWERVAVVDRSADPGIDVDCLVVRGDDAWLELLAGVGAFAVERDLVGARAGVVPVRVRIRFEHGVREAAVHVPVRDGRAEYAGDTAITGVPGTGARVLIEFAHGADSVLLPTGRVADDLGGIPATLIGDGTPVVVIAAEAVGISGYETPARLEYDERLLARIGMLRLRAGVLLGLGDVSGRGVPEVCLVAPPGAGGGLCVRVFGRDRVDPAIGAFTAMSLAAATGLPGSVAARVRRPAAVGVPRDVLRVEHPSGFLDVQAEVTGRAGAIRRGRSAVVSTARLLLEGLAYA